MTYPLAASPRHWPEPARAWLRDFIEDKAATLEFCAGLSRSAAEAEAERQGEAATRAAWLREPILARTPPEHLTAAVRTAPPHRPAPPADPRSARRPSPLTS